MTNFDTSVTQFDVTTTITIRQMKKRDLKLLEWYGQFRHFRNLFLRSYRGQQQGNRYLLIAESNNFPVGRLFIRLNSHNAKIADGRNRAYLYSFQVMDMFRGQGIGTRMIHTAEHILRTKRFKIACIAVAKENAGALRLYQREGYSIYDEDEGHWQYLDHRGRLQHVHEPCYLLEKRL